MVSPRDSLSQVERELQRFPASVVEEYRRAHQHLRQTLSGAELVTWAQQGVDLARHSVRSWESALEFFRSSPPALGRLSLSDVIPWAQQGLALCQESTTMATAYFRATPEVLSYLSPQALAQWGEMGRSLFKGTWKSSALSSKFFEVSPELLRHLNLRDFQQFVALLGVVSQKSYDLATECLTLTPQVLPRIGDHRQGFISLALAIAERNWREVRPYFEVSGVALPRVERSQRRRYLALTESLVRNGLSNAHGYLQETSLALAQLDSRDHSHVLALAESLLHFSPEVISEFLKNLPKVLARVPKERLEAWFQEGVQVLRENPEGGRAYFRIETSRAERALERLSCTVELERMKDLMRLYCRALTGTKVEIQPTQELVNKGIGWVVEGKATTEGTHVFLPEVVDRFSDRDANFQWFKVMATHQVAHLEFNSFDFVYDRPSTRFTDLRPRLAAGRRLTARQLPGAGLEREPQRHDPSAERAWLLDMERFFDLFGDRRLALDLFTVLEDGRIDSRVLHEYRGIRRSYARVQGDALEQRPEMESRPAREALVEFLVRLSLRQYRGVSVPSQHVREARAVARIARRLLHPPTVVEDTAEAALRAYSIIAQIPNEQVPEDQWESMDTEGLEGEDQDLTEEELERIIEQLQGQIQSPEQLQAEGQPYESAPEVEYRGEFKPELAQLLAQLRMRQQGAQGDAHPISQEMLEELLKKSVELDVTQGQVTGTAEMYANNILREAGVNLQQQPEFGQGPISHVGEEGGPLEVTEPRTHVYPEWDFRADDYKPRWCMVRERVLAESDSKFFTETLANYAALASQIRREFEQVVPEMFRKVKRLQDGEDLDLDTLIEAMIDKRVGITPSEKIYWRRNKVQRDVAVVFLLDMSASTAEAIDESRRLTDDWDAPDDPVEYMIWLRTRRGEGMKRPYKRIIDLEKESIVLLIQALETIGDVYGIYGFSGYGRENVEFYVIKDIEEQLSERVKRRIDKISPLHATRMGPAIRHATTKLAKQDARTKFLFLISDGRPQDRGYSREGVEKEYAVHDTKMALTEARLENIVPFCLTVDKQGHDYLKHMCQDMGYEILWDIHSLPRRLPRLYRRLTV